MKVAYLSSAYLAPVEYYSKLLNYDKIFIEQHDHYMKQTYRNRCTIAGPEGELALSIPTVKPEEPKCPMKDIRISDHGNWRHLHWNAIESAYNSTPFFEYYKDDFRPFYEKKYEFLTDFNEELCRLVCELIDIQPAIERTKEYKTDSMRERLIREFAQNQMSIEITAAEIRRRGLTGEKGSIQRADEALTKEEFYRAKRRYYGKGFRVI